MKPADPNPIFAALLLLLVLSGLDQTLLGTMLPALVRSLGRADLAPWVFSSYLTAATIAVPVYGKLADRAGPWPMLLVAAGLFTLGSAACAAAVDMPTLVAARAVQGLGGGGLMTLALLTTAWLYPPAERAKRMGMIGAGYSLATLAGPLAGGMLLRLLPWQSAFLVNLPLAALAWLLIGRSRFGRVAARPARFDFAGATLLGAALAAGLTATRHPIGSAAGSLAAAVAVAAAAGWIASARRAPDPIVPLTLFGDTAFRAAAGLATLGGVVLFGTVVYIPSYLQRGLHFDALHSAFCTVPLMLGITVGAQFVGRSVRAGGSPATLTAASGVLMTAGTAATAAVLALAPTQVAGLAATLLPIGLGLGASFPLTTIIAQRRAPAAQLGAASALPLMLRSLGGAFAVALLGEALRRRTGVAPTAQAMAAGTSTVFLGLTGAAVLSLPMASRLRAGMAAGFAAGGPTPAP